MTDPEQDSTAAEEGAADTVARLAAEYGIPAVESVSEVTLDPELVSGIPVDWARSHGILPVRYADSIRLLTSDPSDAESQEYLIMLLGESFDPLLAPRDVIATCIEQCYYSREDSPGDFLRGIDEPDAAAQPARATSDDLLRVSDQAPVTQLVNLVLLEAVKRGASDVHVEPYEHDVRVRYRIDGVLYAQSSPPKHMEDALISRLKVMAHLDIAEKRLPQDGTARVRVGEREIDIRVSTVPVAEGERVVLRLLDRESALLPLSSLGMAEDTFRRYEALVGEANGIVIVSGPTGSGKTTTLYASLQQLDAEHQNILTVEDPIEYQLPRIGQIQVKPKIGLTFASGLRHILRQDPDIVLVGETRDLETAEIAVRASLTGHLVFTTLHTNDAAGSVLRLVDMGVEPYLLASCLRGVLAQRLVRRLCSACRRERTADREEIARLGGEAATLVDGRVWDPIGCELCLEGYKGRTGLFELMVLTPEMCELVRRGESGAAQLRETAAASGMTTLLQDGIRKVSLGETSLGDVLNATG